MKKILSKVLIACLALCLCGSLAACGSDENRGINADGSVSEITMWVGGSEWSGVNYQNLDKFIKAYNEAKPDGFTVKLENKEDMETSFQTAISTGNQPDVMLWDRFNTATNDRYLYPVDDLIESDELDVSTFYGPVMSELVYKGKTYGLPIDVDVWGTYVNMDFVKQYDAAHPDGTIGDRLTGDWTWDDLLAAAKALNTVAPNGYSAGDQEQHFFKYAVSTGHGSEFLTLKDASKGLYETNFKADGWAGDVLKFFKDMSDANVGGGIEDSSFTNKLYAMVNKPLYYNNYINSYKGSNISEYKFLPQPKQANTGVNGGMVGGYGLVFPNPKNKNKPGKAWTARHDAAWKFAKWLCCDKENMISWAKQIGSLPALTEALEDESYVANNPVQKDAREYVLKKDSGGNYVYITRPSVPNFLTLQTEVINPQIKLYLSGSNSLSKCITEMTSAGNSQLKMGVR